MLKNFNIEKLLDGSLEWLMNTLTSGEAIYQIIVIIVSAILAYFPYRMLRPKIDEKLKELNIPIAIKRIATNVKRLLYHFFVLVLIFIGSQIGSAENVWYDTSLLQAIMKVLGAWIVIKIAVQFISNTLVRNIFATTIWIIAALSIFGFLEPTKNALDAIGYNIGDFRLSALAVIKGLISLFALLYLAMFASGFAERRIRSMNSLTRSSQVLISKVVRVTLIVVALIIGITSAGIDLSLFAVFGGAIGLGIGFGLQKGISNLFSGMLLLLDKSIKPGDVIEVPDIGTFGWVNHMAARYTEIVTRDNKSFLIPNEDFITQRVINWSHGNKLVRIHLEFGVHYDSDPHKVIEIACNAARDLERVVDDPAPVCWIIEFGDNSINFDLRFWIKDAESGVANIRGMVFLALWDAFKEHDIQIPYPHREVFVHKVDNE